MNILDNVIKYGKDCISGNKLYIDKTSCYAYKGAEKKTDCYKIFIEDENGFLFYCSCYETLIDAINGIKKSFPYLENTLNNLQSTALDK